MISSFKPWTSPEEHNFGGGWIEVMEMYSKIQNIRNKQLKYIDVNKNFDKKIYNYILFLN